MSKKYLSAILIPVGGLVILALGILIGRSYFASKSSMTPEQVKIAEVLSLIEEQYVDTLDTGEIVDMSLTQILGSLDPHSAYIPKSELQSVNEDLDGSFSGVGVSFQIVNDTVVVVEAITGGPAEKVGIMAGDRITAADGKKLAGTGVTNEDVFSTLRGQKGTKVQMTIRRPNSPKEFKYTVTRSEIPVNSVDASYMLADGKTGYVKLSKFTPTTHMEFLTALADLSDGGARQFIIDLRNNPGGYMDQAILIANEFLPAGQLIVKTKGRTAATTSESYSDGTGIHQKTPVAILINEYSASASEIIAGAIQDNDRGAVVGRRSYGKGLVQNQTMLPDSSAIRLTVARYYTPSGRSIQKEYERGKSATYELDILDRYNNGEFYSADSIKLDKSKVYRTAGGRKVYGGGGIMPDIFVPEDTSAMTSYYINVSNAGLIQQFSFRMADKYRDIFRNVTGTQHALRLLPSDVALIEQFADYAQSQGVPARWYYINQSSPLLLTQIKAFMIRDLLGYNQFYEIFNSADRTIDAALDVLKSGKLPQTTITK